MFSTNGMAVVHSTFARLTQKRKKDKLQQRFYRTTPVARCENRHFVLTSTVHASARGTVGHLMDCPMGSWDGQCDIHMIYERDSLTSREMSYGPMGSCDGMDSVTYMHM